MMMDFNSLNYKDQLKHVDIFMQRKDYLTAITLLDTLISKMEINKIKIQGIEIKIKALHTRVKALIGKFEKDRYTENSEKDANLNRAISDCTQILTLMPNNTEAYYYRAEAYYYKNLYESALSNYSWAIDVEPKNIMAYIKRGEYYYDSFRCWNDNTEKNENYDKSKYDFEKILSFSPNNNEAQEWLKKLEEKKLKIQKEKDVKKKEDNFLLRDLRHL